MKIEHIALYVNDLENAKQFFIDCACLFSKRNTVSISNKLNPPPFSSTFYGSVKANKVLQIKAF